MFLGSKLTLLCRPHALLRLIQPVTASGLLCAIGFSAHMAMAAQITPTEVQQLLEHGKTQEAAQRVQSALKQNSNDVQMRFLQGVIAAEQQKYDQAIQLFTALTQDYPGLPEPYNNLAVLYAAKGEERKATQVLEQAIRTNPSYATAHENLGDLYARMASDAYAKALQLDSNRKAVQPKLAIIKQIFPGQISAAANAAVSAPAPVVAAAPEPTSVKVAAPVEIASVPVDVPLSKPAETVAAEKAAPAVPKAEAVATKTPVPPPAQAAVEKAVLAWAKAWEQQNMAGYYAAYSSRFDPQGGTLANWKAERKNRIVDKPAITVDVNDLKVHVQGDRATANFRQFYASGGYKATTRKTLRMQLEGEKWRILREETGR
jgi:colicin import membrane protein